jgi:serine/threonine protein kinase
MPQANAVDEFHEGRLSLHQLLDRIDRAFSDGGSAEQSALVASWRRKEIEASVEPAIYRLVKEKIETAYGNSLRGGLTGDRTVVQRSAAPPLVPGQVIKGRFILEELIGAGGMGMVFRALDLRKQEAQDRKPWIALKVLNEDVRSHADSLKVLQREAKKAQGLAHPNIITVFDFDRDEQLHYLTMEFLSGVPLDKLLKTRKALPLAEVGGIVKQIGAALAYAHESGVIHSDLKPANVFATEKGRVKVIDFGIARAVKRGTQTGGEGTMFDVRELGAFTPAYASIDLIEGREPDARDDIFALGCITYELLTGRHPFGRMPATEAKANGIVPGRPQGLTARQWKALRQTLCFERDQRTASVALFLDGFAAAPGGRRVALLGGTAAAASAIAAAAILAVTLPESFHRGARPTAAPEAPAAAPAPAAPLALAMEPPGVAPPAEAAAPAPTPVPAVQMPSAAAAPQPPTPPAASPPEPPPQPPLAEAAKPAAPPAGERPARETARKPEKRDRTAALEAPPPPPPRSPLAGLWSGIMHVTPSKLEYLLKPGRAFGVHDIPISSFRIDGRSVAIRDSVWDLSGTASGDTSVFLSGTYRDDRGRLNDIALTLRYDGVKLRGKGTCNVRASSVKSTCTIELSK